MLDREAAWRFLGENMRRIRRGSGSTLTETAAELGYSKSHLSLVEQGKDRPSDELVQRYDSHFKADGLLFSLYLAARIPRLGRQPAGSRPPSAPMRLHRSAFVCDVTIPDGSIVAVGEEFLKIWRIRNLGPAAWRRYRLARFGPCDGPAVLASPSEVPIADTAPGQHVDITLPLRAPVSPGTSFALWKMLDSEGNLIFPDLSDGLYVLLTVIEADRDEVERLRRFRDSLQRQAAPCTQPGAAADGRPGAAATISAPRPANPTPPAGYP